MGRRLISICLAGMLTAGIFAGCVPKETPPDTSGKIQVVATLFPQYDFARQIVGDRAEVKLLLPPGVESHSFEPTPADVITISRADLFVYTGAYMEPWAERILSGIDGDGAVLDVSINIQLEQEEHPEEEQEEHAAHGGFDPHIWTDPQNAMIMVDNLTAALGQVDPENAAYYQENATAYQQELAAVDAELEQVISTAKRREIVFGGRFALHYFAQRYGLTYTSAFDSCSSETEPSARVVARIIDTIRAQGIPVIFYEELTDPKVARSIGEETGAQLLLLHSCHNVSKDELAAGATYVSLMRQNAANLKVGLN